MRIGENSLPRRERGGFSLLEVELERSPVLAKRPCRVVRYNLTCCIFSFLYFSLYSPLYFIFFSIYIIDLTFEFGVDEREVVECDAQALRAKIDAHLAGSRTILDLETELHAVRRLGPGLCHSDGGPGLRHNTASAERPKVGDSEAVSGTTLASSRSGFLLGDHH